MLIMILKLIRSILTIKECQGPFKAVLDESRGRVACPARFERATYALEALKMSLKNCKNNGIKVLVFGVA